MQDCSDNRLPKDKACEVLLEFLRCPLYDASEVFSRFRSLPGAQYYEGEHPMERFVFVPGKRKDRVLLLAHADTFWDVNYVHARAETTPVVEEERQIVKGSNPDVGLGADDRAGCALLWLLKDTGHSLLITDGEEHGHCGSRFISTNKPLMREINQHRYILALDYPKKELCHYHQIPNAKRFCEFIQANLAKQEIKTIQRTDLPEISGRACGANLSIGYFHQHKESEFLHIPTWYEAYERLASLLSKEQARYRTLTYKRIARAAYQSAYNAGSSVYQIIKKVLHIKQG